VTLFNAAGLLREAAGATREYALRDRYLSVGPEVELAGPVSGKVRLQRTNRGILLRGSLNASLRRTCSRCLEPFEEAVSVMLAEEYLPSVDPERGTPLAPPAIDEEALRLDERHQIDLVPVLRDELVLGEPMHPLCRPDCPGLCPGCGRNMAVGTCDCSAFEPDPRLAALAALLPRETD
jgi:uncharacterized protein